MRSGGATAWSPSPHPNPNSVIDCNSVCNPKTNLPLQVRTQADACFAPAHNSADCGKGSLAQGTGTRLRHNHTAELVQM